MPRNACSNLKYLPDCDCRKRDEAALSAPWRALVPRRALRLKAALTPLNHKRLDQLVLQRC
jgi:hypothetical protein